MEKVVTVEEVEKLLGCTTNLGNVENVADIGKNVKIGKNQKILENLINFKSHKDFQNFKNFKNFKKSCEIYKIMEKNGNVYEKSKSVESLYPHELLYKTELGRIILCFVIGITISLLLSLFLNLGDF
jgi:hypothetical protein